MECKRVYTQQEYDNAMALHVRFAKDGCIFEPAEAVLAVGTKEMQDAMLRYIKKYEGMSIVEFMNAL